MKIRFNRLAIYAKRETIHIQEMEADLPVIHKSQVISTPEQFKDMLNDWNKEAKLNALSGLPIYVYTYEGIGE